MSSFLYKIERWWLSFAPEEQRINTALMGIVLLAFVHYLVYCILQPFYIEDAAISFAYARNFIDGEGFASYPGGERVEGFSNPLWTFLIAFFYLFGISPFVSSKIAGAFLGLWVLPMIYGVCRRVFDQPNSPKSGWFALLIPLMLAASPQFAIWNSSGLENPLYLALISTGMWLVLKEQENPNRTPWSGLCFAFVAMTRPEGVMYAFIAIFVKGVFAVVDRKWRSFLLSILLFGVPFGLYHAWRYWYFAWPYPNTYYAKLGAGKAFKPFGWTIKGWKYINKYLSAHALLYVLPLIPLALVGARGWRFRVGSIALLPLVVLFLWDGTWSEKWVAGFGEAPAFIKDVSFKKDWAEIRGWYLLGYAILAGFLNLGRTGWRARSMLWVMASSSVFFVIYAGGDWMKAHRWFNVVELFMYPFLALGMIEFLKLVSSEKQERSIPLPGFLSPVPVRLFFGSVTLLVFVGVEIQNSVVFATSPETSVGDIHRRVKYMKWVQRRLDVDHITLLDVDMGAHLYYSGWDIVDIAGLVDVPMAQHSDYNRAFIREYIFKERKPDFAHVHGGWARTSRIDKQKEWDKRYIEIPGYPIGNRRLHIGNHINKNLFVTPVEDKVKVEREGMRFGSDLRLLSADMPADAVPQGGLLKLTTEWWTPNFDTNIQVLVIINDGQKVYSVSAFEPGYRWYPIEEWEASERVTTHFRIQIPKDLKQGSYQLRMVVLDRDLGTVLPSSRLIAPLYLRGELDLKLSFDVVSREGATQAALEDKQEALELARQGQCEKVWPKWKEGEAHIQKNTHWHEAHAPQVKRELAGCYFQRSRNAQTTQEELDDLLKARFWDHHLSELTVRTAELAEDFDVKGQELFEKGDWKKAYEAFSTALKLDPSRSWTRRRAEDARDKKLKITRPSRKKKKTTPAKKDKPPKKKTVSPKKALKKKPLKAKESKEKK
ncbi:MAG: hypothetical protein CMK59_09650 [Proteobacteria bacterium]|nr:hypothetical protein [Pseudomonadota bacterium]